MTGWRELAESLKRVPDKTDKTDKTPLEVVKEDSFGSFGGFGKHCFSENQEERSAIQEYDGNLPREWAEAFAKLQFIERPKQYSRTEWEEVINDAGLFADKWARQAIALGWSIVDVFAVHKSENRKRLDGEGVVLSIRGRKVLAVTTDHIMIETYTGAHQRICKPTAPKDSIKMLTENNKRNG